MKYRVIECVEEGKAYKSEIKNLKQEVEATKK